VPAPAELRVEFLPEPNAAVGIAKQIRSSGRAYAVFSTAKLFLERPERHLVRVTSSNPQVLLYQIGDGPISFDQANVERSAFLHVKDEFYREETTQGEPIKGNFSNVARSRSTGVFLGPTNHHGYQPALRRLYDERFSRRMSFPEFQQTEIAVVTDEQAIADWKEQARTTTSYTTIKEAEPVAFKTLFDVEQHFRKTYLPQLVRSGTTLECSGPASRAPLDRYVSGAVRAAWEQERVFPQGLVNALRPYFAEQGLHFFKHRKRVLHVSAIKPLRHAADQTFSDGITAILALVEAQPRIRRPDLAKKLLGPNHDAPEVVARKAQLASDVHYLMQIGHLIEFADGAFELPVNPKGDSPPPPVKASETKPATARPEISAAPAGIVENTTLESSAVQEPVKQDPLQDAPELSVESVETFDDPVESAEAIPETPELVTDSPESIDPLGTPADAGIEVPELESRGMIEAAIPQEESPAATEPEEALAPSEPAQPEPDGPWEPKE
jgi:hypothetical protein